MLLKYLKFSIGGGVISISELILTVILTEFFSVWYIYSYIIALSIGSLALFFYHRYITFTGHNTPKRRYLKFLLFSAFVYLLNIIFLYFLSRYTEYLIQAYNLTNPIFHYHYAFLILIIAIPFSIVHFLINKKYIFVFRYKKTIW